MLRLASQASWRSAKYLHRRQRFSICPVQNQVSPATARAGADAWVAKPSTSHDDRSLRDVFDSHHVWAAFSSQNSLKPRKGLFQNYYLRDPSGFEDFARITIERCKKIVAKVLEASDQKGFQDLPGDLDRLSDSLCRVLDLSDFVRSTHPDSRYRDAADGAYEMLYNYMNVLNTTPGLNEQLESAWNSNAITSSWNEEQKTVARTLLKDFSKSAIHLPLDKRERFVELSSEISNTGSGFIAGMTPAKSTLILDSSNMRGMDPTYLRQITDRRGRAHLPTVGPLSTLALRTVHDSATRKEIFVAGRKSRRSQIDALEHLLQSRAELASLSGFNSYAEMHLGDKMAKTPEAVEYFLNALSVDNRQHIKQELDDILNSSRSSLTSTGRVSSLDAWDREYFRTRLASQHASKSRKPDFLAAYFSLGTVMQGLSRLFTRLYGVRFAPQQTSPGETWNPDVRRLDITSESEGHIAVVYCDLFARAGKNPNPAHFTLRCSRHITPSELSSASQTHPHLDPLLAANDGMATAVSSVTGILHQLPTIALICDFPPPALPQQPTLLSFRDVSTLFHEMGHAIHSILGRTALQVVSGTRCATDFAELPSVLMEHFATDASVLALFARHWETDAPLPYDMVTERLALERKGQGADTEHQILLALLDQAYHSPLASSAKFDSTSILHDIYRKYSSVPEPGGTSAQGFFGHLVEYGATYYSYLFDRAIAGKVWKEVFKGGEGGGAVERGHGERLREEVLRWGGSRDGWRCVAGVLGDERLSEGGAEAMREVGRWGVKD